MTRTQRWTLTVVCAATAMLMLDIAVVNTALSAIAADLDTGLSGLQWVVDAYTLTLAATVITAGSLADRFGRRRLFGVGLSIFTATSLLCAGAQSITMLNVSRAAQGVGAAIMFAVSLAVLSNAFPRIEQRIKALAAYGATMGGSFAIGPLVGGAAHLRPGLALDLPHQPPARPVVPVRSSGGSSPSRWIRVRRAWTAPGSSRSPAACSCSSSRCCAATRTVGRARRSSPPSAAPPLLLCAFVAVEARVAQPMLPLRLFRNPSFTGAQVAAFGISASLFAMWLYMTLYLQQILGLSAIEAGLVYLPGTILNFLVAGATASVGQKVSPRVLIAAGLALIGVGQALLTIVGADSSWWLFLPGLLVAMLGTGMFNPAVSQVALSSAPPEQSGLAAGVNDMFRQAGIAVGVAALGALVPAGAAFGDGSPQSYVDGFHDALWVGAVLAIAAAVAAGLLIRAPGRAQADVRGDIALEAA